MTNSIILHEKKKLRSEMLKKRLEIDNKVKNNYDQWICNELLDLIKNNSYTSIHCYLPMNSEINIYPLIEESLNLGITIICPKTLKNRELKHLKLASLNDLEEGVFKTLHPANNNEYKGDYDLIIVPGLAFDSQNYRLGYGGGYYDSFIKNNSKANKIGVFYPFQEVNIIPTEVHDMKLDTILVNKDYDFN